jgi:DNA-binding response OmpR family regulator/anti-sigma regulatory factor (Ser/Thr protein kinase)
VMRNANRLGELVNQVLDLSKLEAGKMEVEPTYGSLNSFITPLLASYESLAQQRKISFTHDLQIDQSEHAFDHDKLEKIITNLVTNAFKFTPELGMITVNVLSDPSSVVIRVADTGKGISEEDLPYIFTPFYQSGKSEDHNLPGTGLGLALVHELVRILNGKIEVQSKVDEGTEIVVVIPLPDAASAAHDALVRALPVIGDETEPKAEIATESFSETLLIIEDNSELRQFISQHFSKNFNVLTAENGKRALQLAFDQMPSLVVSDVMMPEMDGIEFMKTMKTDSRTDHIPIMLLSAQADQESKISALQLGADEYMTKPFSLHELEVRVNSIISNRKKAAAFFHRMLISPDESKRLAVVEPSTVDSVHSRFIKKLQGSISQNLSEPSFGVEELANEMCLSRTQLFRKVKMVLDTTPSDLISDMRLQQAATMIINKADTLAQIAYSVGFREQSYFAKRFRRKFGVSPREYAERAQINHQMEQ